MRAMKHWQAALSTALLNGNPIADVAHERDDAAADRRWAEYRATGKANAGAATAQAKPERKWFLARWLDALDERQAQRERQAMEAYLAEATDIADLEDRMRRWDRRAAASSYGLRGYNYF